jgi:cell division protein FtsB
MSQEISMLQNARLVLQQEKVVLQCEVARLKAQIEDLKSGASNIVVRAAVLSYLEAITCASTPRAIVFERQRGLERITGFKRVDI